MFTPADNARVRPANPVLVVAVATLLVALDGFDVFSIAFAAPEISAQWGIDRGALGFVLSMELIGMGIGAYALGVLADRIGRRPTILICLALMASGMGLASIANDVVSLSVVRLYTGVGIGGLLATCGALVAESTNDRCRDRAIAGMISGFPMGIAIGGAVAAELLSATGRWQSIFQFGAAATAVSMLLVLTLVHETIPYLRNRGTHAAQRPRVLDLFAPGAMRLALPLTAVFFLHMMTFYFLMKWIPKVVADMGHTASDAAIVLVWANVGGVFGSIALSLLTRWVSVRALVVGALVCGGLSVWVFGYAADAFTWLSVAAVGAGFFTTGASAGLYAIFARTFPTQLRASATGLVIGFGRGGAALGPVCAGLLFAIGWPLHWVAPVLACGSLTAAALLVVSERRRPVSDGALTARHYAQPPRRQRRRDQDRS